MFLYVLSAPVFLGDHLHLAPGQFFWFFLVTIAGIMGGARLSGRLAGRVGRGSAGAILCVGHLPRSGALSRWGRVDSRHRSEAAKQDQHRCAHVGHDYEWCMRLMVKLTRSP